MLQLSNWKRLAARMTSFGVVKLEGYWLRCMHTPFFTTEVLGKFCAIAITPRRILRRTKWHMDRWPCERRWLSQPLQITPWRSGTRKENKRGLGVTGIRVQQDSVTPCEDEDIAWGHEVHKGVQVLFVTEYLVRLLQKGEEHLAGRPSGDEFVGEHILPPHYHVGAIGQHGVGGIPPSRLEQSVSIFHPVTTSPCNIFTYHQIISWQPTHEWILDGVMVGSWLSCLQNFPCSVSFSCMLGVGVEVWTKIILDQFFEDQTHFGMPRVYSQA